MKNDAIIIAKKRLMGKTLCKNCKENTKVYITEIKGTCKKCGKEIQGEVIIEDDALSMYAWSILLRCETENEIKLKATDNNLSGAERLVSIFSKLGLEVHGDRKQVSDKNKKTGKNMEVWQITLKKIGALQE